MRSEELAELDVASFSREVRERSERGNEVVSVEPSVSGESADGVDCEVVKLYEVGCGCGCDDCWGSHGFHFRSPLVLKGKGYHPEEQVLSAPSRMSRALASFI